jgi:AAA domain
MSAWVQRDGYRFMDLGNGTGDDAVPFLVPGLVAATVTLFYGRPKTGKSTLAALAARSIVTGETMLGCAPAVNGKTAVISGDAGDAIQVYGKLIGDVPGVRVCEFARPPTQAAWGALCGELSAQGFRLVVVRSVAHPLTCVEVPGIWQLGQQVPSTPTSGERGAIRLYRFCKGES